MYTGTRGRRGGGEEGRRGGVWREGKCHINVPVHTDGKIHTCTATKDTEELCREYHTELNY